MRNYHLGANEIMLICFINLETIHSCGKLNICPDSQMEQSGALGKTMGGGGLRDSQTLCGPAQLHSQNTHYSL